MSVEQQSRPAVRDRLYVGGTWVTPDGERHARGRRGVDRAAARDDPEGHRGGRAACCRGRTRGVRGLGRDAGR